MGPRDLRHTHRVRAYGKYKVGTWEGTRVDGPSSSWFERQGTLETALTVNTGLA